MNETIQKYKGFKTQIFSSLIWVSRWADLVPSFYPIWAFLPYEPLVDPWGFELHFEPPTPKKWNLLIRGQSKKYKHIGYYITEKFKYYNIQLISITIKQIVCVYGVCKMKRVVKCRLNEQLYRDFKQRLEEMGYESQSEWLREQIRKFLLER
jgi:hypothetical protein